MFDIIFKYEFLQNAIVSSIFSCIVCGIIGVIIVEKKLVMMSGGIAHTAYGGVGLGYLLDFEPIIGAICFSLAAAIGIGYVNKKGGHSSDVMIAMFWSLGMALGIIFVAVMPGYPPDMSSYLFGNILSVTRSDLKMMIIMSMIVTIVFIVLYNDWRAFLFDMEFSTILGLKSSFLEYLLFVLIALTVVILLRVSGIILVIALLTAPAAISGLISEKFLNRIIISIISGIIICFAGLWFSYIYNLPSGAVIILFLIFTYSVIYLFKIIKKNVKKQL